MEPLPHRGNSVRRFIAVSLGCLLAATLAVATAPQETAPDTGSLSGLVKIGPELLSRKMRFSLYPDLRRSTPASEGFSHAREIGNVVIYLESTDALPLDDSAGTGPHVMSQTESTFVPHVLPVLRGSTVEFPNSDPVFHNVFSLSKAAAFDLGRYPNGSSKAVRFDKPGIVKVFCRIHSDMSAVVLVLDNPFFAVPDEEGGFRIEGIPAGEYRALAWHERARPISETVRIRPGHTSVLEFTIPLSEVSSGG